MQLRVRGQNVTTGSREETCGKKNLKETWSMSIILNGGQNTEEVVRIGHGFAKPFFFNPFLLPHNLFSPSLLLYS
jgi:hypothetical protein